MSDKYKVIKEIPKGRFLCSFDWFPAIPVGTILKSNNRAVVYNDGNMCGEICDIDSKLEKEYLQKIEL